ncbi:MAG: hypothetical protein ACRDMV_18260 [Streptosporangiales bacterium]
MATSTIPHLQAAADSLTAAYRDTGRSLNLKDAPQLAALLENVTAGLAATTKRVETSCLWTETDDSSHPYQGTKESRDLQAAFHVA